MKEQPKWQWDEMGTVGARHDSPDVAAKYDDFHKGFRDIDAENAHMLGLLEPEDHQTVLDMGAGTGFFVLAAAERYSKVYAVDISAAMLERASSKATEANLDNIEFCQGGFLTYQHEAAPVDAIVSHAALHHLPDFWKFVALARMAEMLKVGGNLCLRDTVFSGASRDYPAFLNEMTQANPGAPREAHIRHIREEFTTIDWIMEGLITRAGFSIEKVKYDGPFWAGYLCTKESHR
jgi:ubiquinone/menaquinone biosynthesis C-methylase UbiE